MCTMALRILQLACPKSIRNARSFHNTSSLSLFYEEEKSWYPVKHDKPPKKETSILGQIKSGYTFLKEETKLFIEEKKAEIGKSGLETPETDVAVWKFSNNPAILDQWVVTCDSDYNEGYSTVDLQLSENGTGIFSGILDTRLPKDGKIKYSGYCNMRTVPKRKSFKRLSKYDWRQYTHLTLRVRGDGRFYLLNIHCKGQYDITWNDCYHYPMYTTGGPYWQIVKIPFSRFVFSSKGVVQDGQLYMLQNDVTHFGITLADKISGPFKLEIDEIGLHLDPDHYEKIAYEMYHTPETKL